VLNFIQLSGGGGPDGLAIDCEGGLAIAHPVMGAVWLFDWSEPLSRASRYQCGLRRT
jgi:gluconolactonase